MSVARVALTLPGSVHEAERLWYDTGRWPSWVDGLAEVTAVDPGWPHAGASVTWSSGPAGRGRVVERVVEHEPLAGQELEVEDDSLRGRQRITACSIAVMIANRTRVRMAVTITAPNTSAASENCPAEFM